MPFKFASESQEKAILDEIKETNGIFHVNKLAKKLNITPFLVSKVLKKVNFKIKCGNKFGRRNLETNTNTFQEINTEEKAYWLGFLMADGYLGNPNKRSWMVRFGLAKEDKHMVEKFRDFVYPNKDCELSIYKPKHGRGQEFYSISVYSNKMKEDLYRYGCVHKKSLILKFPHGLFDEKFYSHFIRGFFDGDGSFCHRNTRAKGMYFSFVSSKFFSESLSKILFNHKIISSVRRHSKEAPDNYICRGVDMASLIKFYLLVYNDSNVFLARKRIKVEKFFIYKYKELLKSMRHSYSGKGVRLLSNGRWEARIKQDGKGIGFGYFDTKDLAIEAYNREFPKYKDKTNRYVIKPLLELEKLDLIQNLIKTENLPNWKNGEEYHGDKVEISTANVKCAKPTLISH